MKDKVNKLTCLDLPFIGVGAVIWKNEKFLLIKRGKHPRLGEWSIPGGKQELGETIKEAALREILEETGLKVKITDFLEVIDSIQKNHEGEITYHATLIDFSAEWASGIARADSDAIGIAWHQLEELDDLDLWSETKRIIRKSAKLRNSTNK